MPDSGSSPQISDAAILAASVGGAGLLWFNRDVMSVDIALRLILTLAWLGVWTLAALGIASAPVRRALGRTRFDIVDLPVVLAAGAAALAFIGTVLALTGFFLPTILNSVLVLSVVLGLREVQRFRHEFGLAGRVSQIPAAAWLLMVVFASLVPVLSAPPVMYDALNYHLAFPSHWLAAGRFVEFPRHGFSYYPSSYGMLYGYALAAVGPWGATAIHFWLGVVATLNAGALGARIGGAKTAFWAALCFGLTPAVLEVGTYAAADLAVAAWCGAAFAALYPPPGSQPTLGRGALSGFLLGCALAAKYLALVTVLVPFAAVMFILIFSSSDGRFGRMLGAIALTTAIPLTPWLARNLSWTGNPLYPYLQSVFGGPEVGMSIGTHMLQIGGMEAGTLVWAGRSMAALALRTVSPLPQGSFLGPQWLLLLTVAAFVRWNSGDRRLLRGLWVFTIVGLLAWGSLVQMARFILPVLVVAAALAGSAAATLTSSPSPLVRVSFRVLLAFMLFWNATMVCTSQNLDRLGVAAGLVDAHDQYMARWISYLPVVDYLNHDLPVDSKVLFVGEPRSFYVDAPILIEDSFHTPTLVELARGETLPGAIAANLRDLGVTHVLVNSREMELSARLRGVSGYWSGLSTTEQSAIDEFFERWVEKTAGDQTVWVARIRAPR